MIIRKINKKTQRTSSRMLQPFYFMHAKKFTIIIVSLTREEAFQPKNQAYKAVPEKRKQ